MKKFLFLFLLIACATIPARAQVSTSTTRRVYTQATPPATCVVGDIIIVTTSTAFAPADLYRCTAPNTLSGIGGGRRPRVVTTTATILVTDGTIRADASGGAFTITLPSAIGIEGRRFTIKKGASANTVTVAPTASQTIDGVATYSLAAAQKYVVVESDGTNYLIVGNN